MPSGLFQEDTILMSAAGRSVFRSRGGQISQVFHSYKPVNRWAQKVHFEKSSFHTENDEN